MEILRRTSIFVRLFVRQLRPFQGLLIRAFICWIVGVCALLAIGTSRYDMRFILRGTQKIVNNVALVRVPLESATAKERISVAQALKILARLKPSMIGVLDQPSSEEQEQIIAEFKSTPLWEHIVWGGQTNRQGWLLRRLWRQEFHANLAIDRVLLNGDGYVREYTLYVNGYPHILTQLANRFSEGRLLLNETQKDVQIINFRGRENTFSSINIKRLQDAAFDPLQIREKIVLLTFEKDQTESIVTPVGDLSRAEIYGNILDNILERRNIKPLNLFSCGLILLALLALSVYAMTIYPQALAFMAISWIGILYSALSIWLFDQFNLWIPIAAPLIQLLVTYVVLLGYRLTIKDNLSWKLEQERKYLIQVEQMKENFVSLISHDLKTPLAKIQVICDRLLKKDNEKKINQDLLLLRRESLELHRYIQSILKVGQIESKNLELNKEGADINEIVLKSIEDIRSLAEAKKISIITHLEPLFLTELDIVLIKEVVMNLLDNAIKYTPEGGEIAVKSTEIDDYIVLEVSDNGRGISKEELPKIFDKFYRGKDKKHSTKGSGLGLYLVKYFIEKHGGKIFVENKDTGGTRIGFLLPIVNQEENQEQETEETWNTDSLL